MPYLFTSISIVATTFSLKREYSHKKRERELAPPFLPFLPLLNPLLASGVGDSPNT